MPGREGTGSGNSAKIFKQRNISEGHEKEFKTLEKTRAVQMAHKKEDNARQKAQAKARKNAGQVILSHAYFYKF
jgi:hypothetical protein